MEELSEEATKVRDDIIAMRDKTHEQVFSRIVEGLLFSNCDRATIVLIVLDWVRRHPEVVNTKAYVNFALIVQDITL